MTGAMARFPATNRLMTVAIPRTFARRLALGFGVMCTLSCISLLGDGFGHLQFFGPLAAMNILAGLFCSERITRALLLVVGCYIFASLALTLAEFWVVQDR